MVNNCKYVAWAVYANDDLKLMHNVSSSSVLSSSSRTPIAVLKSSENLLADSWDASDLSANRTQELHRFQRQPDTVSNAFGLIVQADSTVDDWMIYSPVTLSKHIADFK